MNLWTSVLEEQEWHSNLRIDRASFLELVEKVRPLLEPDPRDFRADIYVSVEKKVAMTCYLKDQGSYRSELYCKLSSEHKSYPLRDYIPFISCPFQLRFFGYVPYVLVGPFR